MIIPRIRKLEPLSDYRLFAEFDDGKQVIYDVSEDIRKIPSYGLLEDVPGLFRQVQLDQSRTCVYWNEDIDLPSDAIYEYGITVDKGDVNYAVTEH